MTRRPHIYRGLTGWWGHLLDQSVTELVTWKALTPVHCIPSSQLEAFPEPTREPKQTAEVTLCISNPLLKLTENSGLLILPAKLSPNSHLPVSPLDFSHCQYLIDLLKSYLVIFSIATTYFSFKLGLSHSGGTLSLSKALSYYKLSPIAEKCIL